MKVIKARLILGDDHLDLDYPIGCPIPRSGETLEIARQPPWPGGEQRTFRVDGVNYLFDLTDGTQTVSIELAEFELPDA